MKIEIELAPTSQAMDFCKLVNEILAYKSCYATRENIARIVRKNGFTAHIGGRHVAVHTLNQDERCMIITHPTAPDFN